MSKATIRLAQVAGAYLGGAVLALEAYNALTVPLNPPSWIFWLVVLALVSGLPLVTVVAIRFLSEEGGIEPDRWMVRAPRALLVSTVVMVLAGGGSIAWWVVAADDGVRALEEAQNAPTVAVIPFTNRSPDPSDEYFAEGLTAELTRVFTQVEGIKVMAGGAGTEAKETNSGGGAVARELGARTFLEGTVQKAGNRIRVTATLIRTENDEVLWSEKYDRDLVDVFAVQDEISAAIVQELSPTVAMSKAAPSLNWETRSPEAIGHYIRGRALAGRGTSEDAAAAAEEFRLALVADPDFAAAQGALDDLAG